MSDKLDATISISADTSGVEAGIDKTKKSLKTLGGTAQQMAGQLDKSGKVAGAGLGAIGAGGAKSAKEVDRATRRMENSIQRLIAEQKAGEKGSRAYWEALANARGANVAALRPVLDQLDAARGATSAAKNATESWRDSLSKVAPMIAAAFSGAALAGFIGKVVSVQREFDVLNSSLKTVTGSSEAAEREMSWLKDFAKETPFGLAQATQGFVKMKALGLEPTRAALTSFGNTASAMGKDLNQMIEAVADASTGEFERLKEFGIKASKEGDRVSLTFQGVTTTIRNSASEITQYLEAIGSKSFAGAMEERAKTLDGTIAALGDSWDELFRTVSNNNVGGLIFDSVTLANGALEDATTILRAMGGAAQGAGRDTGALVTIQGGMATVFETVAVLGANLKFVLVGIGNEIGGLAAQAAQAAQFNFSGVAAIRRAMVADAEAARREIDATTARILNARKVQEEYARYATRNAYAAIDPRRLDLNNDALSKGKQSTSAKIKDSSALKAEESAYKSLSKSIMEMLEQQQLEIATGEKLTAAQKLRLKVEQEIEKSKRGALLSQIEEAEANEAWLKNQSDVNKALADMQKAREQSLQSVQESVRKLIEEAEAAAYAEQNNVSLAEAVERLALARAENAYQQAIERQEAPATLAALEAELQARKKIVELTAQKGVKEANDKAQEEIKKGWERTSQTIGDTLADYIMGGGKDAATYLKRLFSTLVLQPVVQYGVQGVMGLLGLGGSSASGATGGLGDVFGTVKNLNSLNSVIGTVTQAFKGVAAGASSASLAYANVVGMAGGDSLGALIAANGNWAGVSTGAAASGGASGGAGGLGGLGAAWPLAIVAGMVASNKLYDAGFNANTFDGAGKLIGGGKTLETNILGKLVGDKTANILTGAPVMGYVFNALFGKKLAASGFNGTFGGDAGFSGKNWQFYKGGLFSGNSYVETAMDKGQQQGLADQFLAVRGSVHDLSSVLGLASESIDKYKRSINIASIFMSADQVNKELQRQFETMANQMAAMVLVTDQYSLAEEKRYDTLVRLGSNLSSFNNTLEALGLTAYKAGVVAADGAYKIIAALGGLEQYGSTIDAYYQSYYTEAEKAALTTKQLVKVFETFGQQMPTTAEAYRAMVEQQIAAAESGNDEAAAFAATLLSLSGTFKQVSDFWKSSLDEMLGSTNGFFDGLYASIQSLQAEIAGDRKTILRGTGVMTPDEIRQAIAETALVAPSQGSADQASQVARLAAEALAQAQGGLTSAKGGYASAASSLSDLTARRGSLEAQRKQILNDPMVAWERNWREWRVKWDVWAHLETPRLDAADKLSAQIQKINAQIAAQADVQSTAAAAVEQANAAYQAALQSYKDAQAVETVAQQAYAAQVAAHVTAAAGSISRLSDLRGEVMSFYETQIEAVEGMLSSAANLRSVVQTLRMTQLTSAQTAQELGARYAMDYSMALATSGATRAGYVDSMAGNLGALSEALKAESATGADWRVETAKLFAQASNAAGLLEGDAQSDSYQDVALGLLDSIDAALLDLGSTAKTAEQFIVQAIEAGSQSNLDGLRAVVAALKGEAVPAFAAGGFHSGGVRLVGERGPELEMTGPARYWSAGQTAAMLGGGGSTERVERLLMQLIEEQRVQAARQVDLQLQLNKQIQRWDAMGMPEERVVTA